MEIDILATPPTLGSAIKIDGLPLKDAVCHPAIGPALDRYHDSVYLGSNPGAELFALAYICAKEGHPLREFLPADVARRSIWDYGVRCNLAFRQATLIATTIHGSKTLLRNQRFIARATGAVVAQSRRMASADILRDYLELAMVKTAMRYDPARGFKFSTYARFRLRGAAVHFYRRGDALDLAESFEKQVAMNDSSPVLLGDIVGGLQLVTSSYGQVGPYDSLMANCAERLMELADRARLSNRQRRILLGGLSQIDGGELRWNKVAAELGISPAQVSVNLKRMRKKLAPFVNFSRIDPIVK